MGCGNRGDAVFEKNNSTGKGK
ncbi:hypothetical protein DWX93_14815 [Roseburia hominis]|uniref:Uncharacterized protein n=1 Tax=Roseburia hominis TaxID=301301 RepID=A0A395V7Y6_9FIRM|nr:hypothetical protein DWX93_14815 [Roseburia hominis]